MNTEKSQKAQKQKSGKTTKRIRKGKAKKTKTAESERNICLVAANLESPSLLRPSFDRQVFGAQEHVQIEIPTTCESLLLRSHQKLTCCMEQQ